MACRACEQRRIVMALMASAIKEWTSSPTGPSVRDIYLRLRQEAIARGELDGTV